MDVKIIRRPRQRSIRLTYRSGSFVLTAGQSVSMAKIQDFLTASRTWMERTASKDSLRLQPWENTRSFFLKHKIAAKKLITDRLGKYAGSLGLTIDMVKIRDQSSRWGSCSRSGSLSFNYRLVFIPVDILDYVVVHELCHLHHFDHSSRFWSLVSQIIPDYKERRRALRCYRL